MTADLASGTLDSPIPPPSQSTWAPGIFVGGPVDGEGGPTTGDRVTVVRHGTVHVYRKLMYRSARGGSFQAWIYSGPVDLATQL